LIESLGLTPFRQNFLAGKTEKESIILLKLGINLRMKREKAEKTTKEHITPVLQFME